MSSIIPILTFNLDGTLLGVDATLVKESVWLPELTPLEEAPPYVVGMFSLRGQFAPVTDLNLRLGHASGPYGINDQVVVLERDGLLMGLIVSELLEVVEVSREAVQPAPKLHVKFDLHPSLIAGEIRLGDDIATLLDTIQLVDLPLGTVEANAGHPARRFCPEATPEQRVIFRARARALMETSADGEGGHPTLALAVVEMGNECFGIEIEAVQEFCEITAFSPIPCCPPHILGVIGLRGNLLTLLDLRTALNLPGAARSGNKVVVARSGGHRVGVSVDAIHDVVYLRQEELQAAPDILREQCGTDIKGAVHYANKMMVVLDLPALLARDEWIVNEGV
jgi:purine-binding chemotaxis protein CheW